MSHDCCIRCSNCPKTLLSCYSAHRPPSDAAFKVWLVVVLDSQHAWPRECDCVCVCVCVWCVHMCVYVCVCVCALLLPVLVSKLNCLYLLQEKKKKQREDGECWGVGVKINLLDQKIFNFAAHQTNFVFRQGVLRRARLFSSSSSSFSSSAFPFFL